MRALMVTPSFYPIKGGAETVVLSLSKELNKLGVLTDVLTFNMSVLWNPKWNGKTEKIDNVTVYKIPGLNWLPVVHSPRVTFGINLIPGRFTHIMKKYDILHFHQAEFSFPIFSNHIRKPKIMHLHGLRFDYYERYHLSRILLKTAADIYLSLTKQMKKELIALGIPEKRVVHYPNSIDTRIFHPAKDRLENTILYVGRITHDKGLHVLLESLKYIKKPVHLLIVGPLNYGSDLKYYETIVGMIRNENSKGKHIIKYLGTVEKGTLLELFQSASVFVLPSLYEPFGIVILEAMACETPVVATCVGGVPEIVNNYINGILVPAGNSQRLGEAIYYLTENEDVRTSIGKAGRKCVEEKFDLRLQAIRLIAIYKTLLNC